MERIYYRASQFTIDDTFLLSQLLKLHNLTLDDSENIIQIKTNDGVILPWDDYLYLELPEPLELNYGNEPMVCDGILLFGDFTIELHDKENYDAYNWCNFDKKSLALIGTILMGMVNKR